VTELSRREFLVVGASAAGGLALGFALAGGPGARFARAQAAVEGPSVFAPDAFIRIGSDGVVTLVMCQVEMGQGTYTALSQLLAEELEVDLDQVRLEHAPPNDALYRNPFFGDQETGGSTSVRGFFVTLRHAGAAARMMLVAAAAKQWGVEPSACRVEHAAVIHPATGRGLSYGALAEAAAKETPPAKVELKEPKDWKLVGTPAKRVDSPDKVKGAAKYGIDVRLPGMKVATVAASPVLGGKVAALDEAKAKAVPGVRQVVNLGDVVAVVADHMGAAKQGLAALALRWDDGPNAGISTADVARDLAAASQEPGVLARIDGDASAALGSAATKHDAVYEVPFLAHAAMEPLNCTVHVQKDACEVWTGTQVLSRAHATAARVTGLAPEKVVVHNHLLGGGFGRRLEFDVVTQAVRIGQQVDGPVKVVWTREEDIQHDVYRPYYYDRIAAGLDASGKPVAWTHRIVGPSILARYLPAAFRDGIDPDAVDAAVHLTYDIPAIRVEYVRHETPVLNTGFWRGVGPTHNCFVIESFVDELAAAGKTDPVAYRRALLGKAPRARAVLDLAAEAAGWGKPLPAGRGRGVSLLYSSWDTYVAQVAEVEVTKRGVVRLRRVVCAADCGTMVNPDIVKAQLEGGIVFGASAALWGEITLAKGRVQQANFTNYRVMRMDEAPAIDVRLVKSSEAPGGLGEPGTAAIAPAIANAVFAATGQRLRKLPLRPAAA